MTANLYRVETEAVLVDVHLGAQGKVRGQMFLRPSIVALSGVESIADRMNDRDAFFPVRTDEPGGRTVIVGKSQVRYVASELPLVVDDSLHDGEVRPFAVAIELDDGAELQGVFHGFTALAQHRLLDFVNADLGLFVPLAAGSRHYVVNRSFIRRLSESSGAER